MIWHFKVSGGKVSCDMEGIINIYKEKGYTSHDVVAKLRGILHMKKIGHTGTLDPDAEGVLPVCLGTATKLCGMITDWDKTYEAVMLLGKSTDTQDISGKVLCEKEVNVDEKELIDVIMSFIGEYNQIPPMYSALKHNGKKLYELARQGIEVEREPRKVVINSIWINDINLEDEEKTVTMTVNCSKGTYIRTLCNDIGEKLGCKACMAKLTRTRVGKFDIDSSMTIEQVQDSILYKRLEKSIVSVDKMFEYPKISVMTEYNKLLYNGNTLPKEIVENFEIELGKYRVYDDKDTFIGIYEFTGAEFKIEKMFYHN